MTSAADDDDPDPRTIRALADAAKLTGAACQQCGTTLCGHAAVFALVLGYKSSPRCLRCCAAHMAEDIAGLRERTLEYVRRHDCFDAAWRRAGEVEGVADPVRPACLWHVTAADGAVVTPREPAAAANAPDAAIAARWDAGAMGCGDLVLELRQRLAALASGGVLALRAEDPGAVIDLPAWCNLTGHTLVAATHPEYRIHRKR